MTKKIKKQKEYLKYQTSVAATLLAIITLIVSLLILRNLDLLQYSFFNSFIGMATLGWFALLPAGLVFWLTLSPVQEVVQRQLLERAGQRTLSKLVGASFIFALTWTLVYTYLLANGVIDLNSAVDNWLILLIPIGSIGFGLSFFITFSDKSALSKPKIVGSFILSALITLLVMITTSYLSFFLGIALS